MSGAQQLDANYRTIPQNLYDPAGVQFISPQAGAAKVGSDGTNYAPIVHQISPNNTGLPVNTPVIIQKTSAASTGNVATLAKAFTNNNVVGNSIIVVCGNGNNGTLTVTDSAGNTYTQAVLKANSTTFEAAIFYAVNIVAGANIVTVTNAGSAASMALEIYEVSGLLAQVVAQPDQSVGGTGTSATPSLTAFAPASPNSLAFLGIAVGTAAQAASVTSGTNWTLDSTQNTTTPSGLFTFGSLSQYLAGLYPVIPTATIAGSEPYAAVAAIFKPVVVGVEGTFNLAAPYPLGAVPKNATSGDVAAATAAATLAAVAGKTTYITGFTFTSTGSTSATTVDITVTDGTWTMTFVFVSVAGATTVNPQLIINFPYPIPASATNTTIVASSPTLGSGNLHACMNATGFQL